MEWQSECVIEIESVKSNLGTGSCGRCGNCRCGEKNAAPLETGMAFRAAHATVSHSDSITAMPAVSGTECRPYSANEAIS